MSVFIDADESGLLVKGTVGSAIARAYVAQMLSMVDSSIKASEMTPESGELEIAPAAAP